MRYSSNYPDDIRKYDNDPRSPFYDSGAEDEIEAKADELREGEEYSDYTDEELLDEAAQILADEKEAWEEAKAEQMAESRQARYEDTW